MQWRDSILAASIAMAGAIWLAPAPAGAGTLYRWKTKDGTLAFADDVKRIPERYRAHAEEIQTEGLDGYGRLTPTDGAAQQERADQLGARLEGLREQSGVGADPAGAVVIEEPPAQHPLDGIALQSVQRSQGRKLVTGADGKQRWVRTTRAQIVDTPVPVLGVDAQTESDEPVVVERVRVRPANSMITRHVTVVRQGDRVLTVIKPRSHQHQLDFPSEEELER